MYVYVCECVFVGKRVCPNVCLWMGVFVAVCLRGCVCGSVSVGGFG